MNNTCLSFVLMPFFCVKPSYKDNTLLIIINIVLQFNNTLYKVIITTNI